MTRTFDRSGLLNTLLELEDKEEKRQLFTWCGNVGEQATDAGIQALYIAGIGAVEYPVSDNGIAALKTRCTTVNNEIEASNITVISNNNTSARLENLITHAFEGALNIELNQINVNVEAKLEKLVLCEDGKSYVPTLENRMEPGKVGIFFLQVPLETEQCAVSLLLHNGTQSTQLPIVNKHQPFAALFTGSRSTCGRRVLEIQSEPGKTALILIYNLIWVDYLKLSCPLFTTDCFTHFLIQTHKLSKVLSVWDFKKEEPGIGDEETKYLCLPLNAINGRISRELLKRRMIDSIVSRSLSSIKFIDVNFLCLSAKKSSFTGKETNLNMERLQEKCQIPDEMRISRDFYGEACLNDGLLDFSAQELVKHLVGTLNFLVEDSSHPNRLFSPTVVIRPRHLKHLILGNNPGNDSVLEVLVNGLKNGLASIPGKTNSEKIVLKASLSQLLQQTIEVTLNGVPHGYCQCCLFTSLLNACIRLELSNRGLVVLDLMLDRACNKWLSCTCPATLADAWKKLASALIDFHTFSNGLNDLSEKFIHLVKKLLKEQHFSQVFDLGNTFLFSDNSFGAYCIFSRVDELLEGHAADTTSQLFQPHFKAHWLSLAIHLFEENTDLNHELLGKFLESLLLKELNGSQLIETVEFLYETLTSERVDCRFGLLEFGRLIARLKSFRKFQPEDFLKMLRVYNALNEPEVLSIIWNAICSDCMYTAALVNKRRCLFCEMLLTSHSNITEVFGPLVSVPGIDQVLQCSMRVVFYKDEKEMDCKSLANFLKNVAILKDSLAVGDAQGTNQFNEIIHRQSSHRLCELLHAIFKCSFDSKLFEKYPSLNEFFSALLNEIVYIRDKTQFTSNKSLIDDVTKAFEVVAWCGERVNVETMLVKIDEISEDSLRVTAVSSALLSRNDKGENAASSLRFKREVFNLLLLDWLKSPRHTLNSLFTIFSLFSEAEKNFIDSAPEDVAAEFTARLESLTFKETVKFVWKVFAAEMKEDGPCLEKFPACWKIYTKSCRQVLGKMDLKELHKMSVEGMTLLVQSFLWLRNKESIEGLTRLVCVIPAGGHLADVHEAIISDKKTEELAIRSAHGVMALNDIIDARIQRLNMRFACELTQDNLNNLLETRDRLYCSFGTPAKRPRLTRAPLPEVPQNTLLTTNAIQHYTKDLEHSLSSTSGATISDCLEKIASLQSLRRKLLATLSGEGFRS